MAKDASQDLNSGISRRKIVSAGFGAIAAPAVLRIIPANAQSRVVKIGHVSPKTGPLAGFGEADGFILEQVRGILAKGLQSGGRKFQVHRIIEDSQTMGSRPPLGALEPVLADNGALIVSPAKPINTNSVAHQKEVTTGPA